MKTILEIYFVKYWNGLFPYIHEQKNISRQTKDPDTLVLDALRKSFPVSVEGIILHSTSWRYDDKGEITLTYLVYSDHFDFVNTSHKSISFGSLKVSHGRPSKPRPEYIAPEETLSHGLRHLAFLVTSQQELAGRLNKESLQVFHLIDSLLAGRINHSLKKAV